MGVSGAPRCRRAAPRRRRRAATARPAPGDGHGGLVLHERARSGEQQVELVGQHHAGSRWAVEVASLDQPPAELVEEHPGLVDEPPRFVLSAPTREEEAEAAASACWNCSSTRAGRRARPAAWAATASGRPPARRGGARVVGVVPQAGGGRRRRGPARGGSPRVRTWCPTRSGPRAVVTQEGRQLPRKVSTSSMPPAPSRRSSRPATPAPNWRSAPRNPPPADRAATSRTTAPPTRRRPGPRRGAWRGSVAHRLAHLGDDPERDLDPRPRRRCAAANRRRKWSS